MNPPSTAPAGDGDRYRSVVRVHVLIRSRDGKILFTRRTPQLPAGGRWQLPGGHLEAEESILDAATRECAEEVGVELVPTQLRLVHLLHFRATLREPSAEAGRLAVFLSSDQWSGTLRNDEPDRCDALRFARIDEPPIPTVRYIATALASIAAGKLLDVAGWASAQAVSG